jgi:hypothetical protein
MGKNYCVMENIQDITEGEFVNRLKLEKYVFCITTIYLRNMTIKAGEQNQFSYAPNQDRYRWNEMILWVQETTLTTTSEGSHMLG